MSTARIKCWTLGCGSWRIGRSQNVSPSSRWLMKLGLKTPACTVLRFCPDFNGLKTLRCAAHIKISMCPSIQLVYKSAVKHSRLRTRPPPLKSRWQRTSLATCRTSWSIGSTCRLTSWTRMWTRGSAAPPTSNSLRIASGCVFWWIVIATFSFDQNFN